MRPVKLRAFQLKDPNTGLWSEDPANLEPADNKLRRQARNKRKTGQASARKKTRKVADSSRKKNRAG